MRQRRMTIIAVACGVLCAVCIGAYLASVKGAANAERAEVLARFGGEQVEVCVATRDIAAGERLGSSSVEDRLWVADLLPEGAIRQSGDATGRIATTSILKGEVVSEKRFEVERGVLDVPAGKEAVSVPAKAVQAAGGAIRPGMSVDVYSSGDSTTALLAEKVVVIDTSVKGSGSLLSSEAGWITLAVEPDRVQEIIAAASKTSLYFVVPGEGAEASGEAAREETSAPAGSSPQAVTMPPEPTEPRVDHSQASPVAILTPGDDSGVEGGDRQ